MLATDIKYLVVRKEKDHNVTLTNYRAADKRAFDHLINRIFQNIPPVYPSPTELTFESKIASYFYEECYAMPKITFGAFHGADVSTKEFLDEVILNPQISDSNRICLLLGNVGCGKTAFINSLISLHLKTVVDTGKFWFVRLDVQDSGQGDPLQAGDFIKFLSRKVLHVVADNRPLFRDDLACIEVFEELRKFETKSEKSEVENSKSQEERSILILSLIENIRRIGRNLILIIDNLDYLCHLFDRRMFRDDFDTGELPFLLNFANFVGRFSQGGPFDHRGITVLLSARVESYRILCQTDETSFPNITSGSHFHVFTIAKPHLQEVLDSREKLLEYIIKLQPNEKKEEFDKISKKIKNDIAKAPKLVDHLEKISNYGFREIMLFFSQYGWVGENEPEGRFINQIPVALITFMLNRKIRYNQFYAKFPNIYLVSAQPKSDSDQTHFHSHTYWLKRLIVHLLEKDINLKPSDVIAIFNADKKGYEIPLIKECLGSLSEANSSNLVFCSRERHLENKNAQLRIIDLCLSDRGKHCITEIFDRFFYLQLIVEDYLLPIPKVIAHEFDYFKRHLDVDYRYVISENDYTEGAKKMIKIKARQVLLFLKVLHLSLLMEKEIYPSVFRDLVDLDVRIPEISGIRKSVKTELETINRSRVNFIPISEIEKEIERYTEPLKQQLMNIYRLKNFDIKVNL